MPRPFLRITLFLFPRRADMLQKAGNGNERGRRAMIEITARLPEPEAFVQPALIC